MPTFFCSIESHGYEKVFVSDLSRGLSSKEHQCTWSGSGGLSSLNCIITSPEFNFGAFLCENIVLVFFQEN